MLFISCPACLESSSQLWILCERRNDDAPVKTLNLGSPTKMSGVKEEGIYFLLILVEKSKHLASEWRIGSLKSGGHLDNQH